MPKAPPTKAATAMPCACTLLRKASRAVARRYEAELANAGLSATQFSILRALERHGRSNLSRLAETLVLERTSLYRALRPLAENRLVDIGQGADRRSKDVVLTPAGARKIGQALPHWQRAQRQLIGELGGARWSELARELDDLLLVVAAAG
jgi:DNA-binding MarR family transcriptional regulator